MSAGAVVNREISFDEPRDLSECPGPSCEAYAYNPGRRSHYHCAIDGCIIEREDEGQPDLTHYAPCFDCQDVWLNKACAPAGDDGHHRCSDCSAKFMVQREEADLLVNNLLDAADDIRDAMRRLGTERDPEKITRACDAFRLVQRAASEYAHVQSIVRIQGHAA